VIAAAATAALARRYILPDITMRTAAAILVLFCCGMVRAQAPAIAAASDLRFALDEVAAAFEKETKRRVRVAYGSSGNFFTQIENGAPFEMLLSADEEFIFKLAASGRAEDRGTLYATGRIVLFAPHGSPIRPEENLAGLGDALARIRRFSIANPDHAPYGRAAEQALKSLGVWEAVRPKLVLGENVSQAAQFAISGSAQGGVFAYSLALSPAVSKAGTFVLLPEKLHAPLRQRMVVIKGAGETTRSFYAYLQQGAARSVLKRYGFALPGSS
jgi:molybdate transport system substrate-binding protein